MMQGFSFVLIHHSDRGLQYCSSAYTGLLQENKIQIRLTQDGRTYDNAVTKRINGILKDEFGLDDVFENFIQVQKEVKEAIVCSNELRRISPITI
jgi:transposase InsO family protein